MSHLFKLEDVLVEVVLETFVGEVDAELFEAVVLVILKTENVEHSNGQDLTDTTRNTGEGFTPTSCLDGKAVLRQSMSLCRSYLGGLHKVLDVEQSVVDPEDNPVKQSTVQGLCHGVSHRTGLKEDTHSRQKNICLEHLLN